MSTAALARKVGIAFQNPDHQLFSDSVENEITFALKNFGFDEALIEKRLDWALGFFGLEEYRKSSPLILSGGEKKRLTLASILAWDPDVVVLDEPTVGQDAIQKEKLAEITRMLHSAGKTIIIVSHDVEFLWTLQPRLLVMKQGSGGRGRARARRSCTTGRSSRARGSPSHSWSSSTTGFESRPDRPFLDVSRGQGLDREGRR